MRIAAAMAGLAAMAAPTAAEPPTAVAARKMRLGVGSR